MEDSGQRAFHFADDGLRRIPATQLQKLKSIECPANRSGAFFAVEISTREDFVVKLKLNRSDIVAEAMGWLLSKELGVRTPNGSVVVSEGCASGWASQRIDRVLGWDPDEADLCDQYDVAGLFVLDALIGNPDRHFDNVLVEDVANDQPKVVYSIDLGLAWLGNPSGFLDWGMDIPEVAPNCYLDGSSRNLVEAHAPRYLEACGRLAAEHGKLEGLAYRMHDWTGLLDESQRSMLVKALRARLNGAKALMGAFLDATLGPEP